MSIVFVKIFSKIFSIKIKLSKRLKFLDVNLYCFYIKCS
nr:MAG TPA: hypothetical protein [Caudoviricetes sp.]